MEKQSKRVKTIPPVPEGSFLKALEIMLPIIVYRVIDVGIVYLGAVFVEKIATTKGDFANFCISYSSQMSVIIKIVALLLATAGIMPYFKKETPVIFDKKYDPKLIKLMACILLGGFFALSLNYIFYITGYSGVSETYNAVVKRQMGLDIWLGVLVYGVVSPFAEEVLFRGVVYNRLRRNYGLVIALIFSPLLFGVLHGNIVQGTYGFIIGLVICVIYEKLGGFIYVFAVHAAANIAVYVVMNIEFLKKYLMTMVSSVIMLIIATILFIYVIFLDRMKTE